MAFLDPQFSRVSAIDGSWIWRRSPIENALKIIKQEIPQGRDAEFLASARCTFVYTNGILLHFLPSFRILLPRNSASVDINVFKS